MVTISKPLQYVNYSTEPVIINGETYNLVPPRSLKPRNGIILIVNSDVFAANPRRDLAMVRDGKLITR